MFVPLTEPPAEIGLDCLVFTVARREVDIARAPQPDGGEFLGILDGTPCWAVEVAEASRHLDLRRLWGTVDDETWAVACRAVQIVDWARTHRYCGSCGTPTEQSPGERARRCPACGLLAFPRIAPAVIVLIERDDGRALLARNVNFPGSMFSCLAGFVEPGENLEQAAVREVREEVGIDIGDLVYFGSQPWPFPHSLMVGYRARYLGGEIVCEEAEIAEADWFSANDLPDIPPAMSIARRLIDDWVRRTVEVGHSD
jgi:NAD+ diphosphatase